MSNKAKIESKYNVKDCKGRTVLEKGEVNTIKAVVAARDVTLSRKGSHIFKLDNFNFVD